MCNFYFSKILLTAFWFPLQDENEFVVTANGVEVIRIVDCDLIEPFPIDKRIRSAHPYDALRELRYAVGIHQLAIRLERISW